MKAIVFCYSGGGDADSEPVIRQPRHAHIPDIGLDHNVMFELLVFGFSIMSLCLQYINLYKTVWWLPHSHATYALVRRSNFKRIRNICRYLSMFHIGTNLRVQGNLLKPWQTTNLPSSHDLAVCCIET